MPPARKQGAGRETRLLDSTRCALIGTAPIDRLLANLQAGQTYQVHADGQLVTTVTASSQGTLSFTTPAGARNIEVSI
jgi:hypothetical protein